MKALLISSLAVVILVKITFMGCLDAHLICQWNMPSIDNGAKSLGGGFFFLFCLIRESLAGAAIPSSLFYQNRSSLNFRDKVHARSSFYLTVSSFVSTLSVSSR